MELHFSKSLLVFLHDQRLLDIIKLYLTVASHFNLLFPIFNQTLEERKTFFQAITKTKIIQKVNFRACGLIQGLFSAQLGAKINEKLSNFNRLGL